MVVYLPQEVSVLVLFIDDPSSKLANVYSSLFKKMHITLANFVQKKYDESLKINHKAGERRLADKIV